MPKERLQTKWNPTTQAWEVFLSMEDHHSERGTINLVAEAGAKNVANITSLEDVQAIRAFLQNPAHFKIFNKVQERRDYNRKAALTKVKQKPEIGFFLQVGASLLGASLATPVINAAVGLGYAKEAKDTNKQVSYSDLFNQAISALVVAVIVAAIGMGIAYGISHKKHHEIVDADNEHKTINELLGRLDKIKHEVQVKNLVLSKVLLKINDILRLNIDPNESRNKNFINEIIAALDLNNEDNLETWDLFGQSISNLQVNNLEINDNDLRILKNKLINEYRNNKPNLQEALDAANNLTDLLRYIDTNMSPNQIAFGEKILPKAFIAIDIVQLLQGKHLIQRENAVANPPASSSSSNNNNNPAASLAIYNQSISNQNPPANDIQNDQP